MPRNFLVKRRSLSRDQGAWPDDDVISAQLPVLSHESPDSGYSAHSPMPDESTLPPTGDTAAHDVTSGPLAPPPPSLMASLRSLYQQQLIFRRRATETILAAAAAKTGNASLLPTGNSSMLRAGSEPSAGLFPVCSLPLVPYLIPATLGNGAHALNLCSRTSQLGEPKTATAADEPGQTTTTYCMYNATIILESVRSICI